MKKRLLLLTLPLLLSISSCGGGNESTSESSSQTSSDVVTSSGSTSESSLPSSQEEITTQVLAFTFNSKTDGKYADESFFNLPEGVRIKFENLFGTKNPSIRFGSAKQFGVMKLFLTDSVKVSKIEVKAKSYSSDGKAPFQISLGGNSSVMSQNIEQDQVYTYNFNSSNSTNMITLENTVKRGRIIVESIKIYGVQEEHVEVPAKLLSYDSSFALTKGNATDTRIDYDGYYKPAINDNLNMENFIIETGSDVLPSTGKQKMLVIPVDFVDAPASALGDTEEATQQEIFDGFFGDSQDTGWESVRTFYEKSSYGALELVGDVTSWYHAPYTTDEFVALEGETTHPSSYDPTWTLLSEATAWAKTTFDLNLDDYDSDQDGLIDGVWLVYSCPTASENDSEAYQDIFWAYTYELIDNMEVVENTPNINPLPYRYCWASYHFFHEGQYGKPDAHTFIHETGHLMGLDDYYSYDIMTNEGMAGGVDMMDANIGDHGAYSKYLYNWTSPYVIDGTKDEVTIALKPFESSGECIVLKQDFNDSPFDEYLILDFYTPTGLNELDLEPYVNGYYTYEVPGLRISHIDSRIAACEYKNGVVSAKEYVDHLDFDSLAGDLFYQIAANNSPDRVAKIDENAAKFRLYHLLEASKELTFDGSKTDEYGELNPAINAGNSNVLFKTNDVFDMKSFASFFPNGELMNDGTTLPYQVKVGEITPDGNLNITITLLK